MQLHQGFRRLAAILNEVYGVGALVASRETVSWAVDRLTKTDGAEVAKRELSAMNRRRDITGRPLVYLN
jgi:hypothetical protein